MKGLHFTHVHPSYGGSFSVEDIICASSADMQSIGACGRVYWHRASRPAGGWPNEQTIRAIYTKHRRLVDMQLQQDISNGIISVQQADDDFHHLIWEGASQEMGIPYDRIRW